MQDPLLFSLFAALFIGLLPYLYVLIAKPKYGNPVLMGILALLFLIFTTVQLAQDGIWMFFVNHSGNLTGVQVWWDVIMAGGIAFFFIAPRARKQGMHLLPWAVFVFLWVSIGLLAMCARLFWLERAAESRKN